MTSDDFEARQKAARERVSAFEKAQAEKAAQKEAEAYQNRLDKLAQKREETLKEVEAMHDSTSNLSSFDPNDLIASPTKITPARQKSKTQEQRLKEQMELKARLEQEEADRRAKLDAVRQQQATARKNRLEREKNREKLREQQRLEQQRLADQQIRASQANVEELQRIAREQQERLQAFGVNTKTKKEQQEQQLEAARKAREQQERLERMRLQKNASIPTRSFSGPRRKSTYIELKETQPILQWEDISKEVAQNQLQSHQDLSVLSEDQQQAMKEYQERLAAAMEEIPQEDVEEFQKFTSRRGSTHVNVNKSKRSSISNDHWNLEDFDINDYTTPKERKAALKAYKKQLDKQGIQHDNLEDLDDVAAFQKMMELQKKEREASTGIMGMIDTSRTRHDNDELNWKLDLDDFDLTSFGSGTEKRAAKQAYKQQQQLQEEDDDKIELDINDFEDEIEFHKLIRAQNRKQRGSGIDTSRNSHSSDDDWNINLDDFDPSAFANAREREAALQAYKTQLAMQQSFQLDLEDLPGVQDFRTLEEPSIQPGRGRKPDINWEDAEMVKVAKEFSDSGQSLDLLNSIAMDQSDRIMEEDESGRSSMNGSSKRRSGAGTQRINRRTLRRQRSSSLGAMDRSQGLRRVKTMDSSEPDHGAQRSRPSYNWTAPDFNWSNFKEAGAKVAEDKKNKKKDPGFKRGNTVALSPTRERKKSKSPTRSSRGRRATMAATTPPSRGLTRQRSSSLTDMARGKDRSSTKKEKDKSPSRSSHGRRATTVATPTPTKRGITRQRSSSLTDMKRGSTKSPTPKDKKKDKKSKSPMPNRGITRQLSSSLSDLKYDWKEEASKRGSTRRSSTMDKDSAMMQDKSSKRGSMRRSSTMDNDSTIMEDASMKDGSKRGGRRSMRRSSTMDKDSTIMKDKSSKRGSMRRSSTMDNDGTIMEDASMKDVSKRGSRRSMRRSSTMDKDSSMKDTSTRGSRRGGRRSSNLDKDDETKDKENKNNDSKHNKSSSKSGTEETPDTFYNWISHSKDAISRLESKKAALEERRKKKKQQRKDRRTEQTMQQMSQEYEMKMAQLKSTLEAAHAQQLESIKVELSGQLNELKGTLAEQQRQREEDEARRIEKERQEEEARRARQLEEDMAISISSIGIGSMGDTVLSDESNTIAMDSGKVEDVQEKDDAPKPDGASEEENNAATDSVPNMDGYVNVMGCIVKADSLDASTKSEPPADNTPSEDAAVSQKMDNKEEAPPDSPHDAAVAGTEPGAVAPTEAAVEQQALEKSEGDMAQRSKKDASVDNEAVEKSEGDMAQRSKKDASVDNEAVEKSEGDVAQTSKKDASVDNELAIKDAKTAVTDVAVTPGEAKEAASAKPEPDDATKIQSPPPAAAAKTSPKNKKKPVAIKTQGANAAKKAQPAAGKKPAATPAPKTGQGNKNAKSNAGTPPPSNTGKKEAVAPAGKKTPPANAKKPPANKAAPAANKKPIAGTTGGSDKNAKAKKTSDASPIATSSVGTDATEDSTLDGSTGSKEGPATTKATPGNGKSASVGAPSVTKQGSKNLKANAAPVASKRTSLAKETNEAENAKKKTVPGPAEGKPAPPKPNQAPKTVKNPSPPRATQKAAKNPSPPRAAMDDASDRSAASKGKRGSFFGKAVKGMKGIMGRRGSLLGSKNTNDDMNESKKESTEPAGATETKQQDKIASKKTPAKPATAKSAVGNNKAKQSMQALGNKNATKEEATKKKVKSAAGPATKATVKGKTANNAANKTAAGAKAAKVLPERELSDIVRDKIREGLEPKTRSPKKSAYKPPKPAKLEPDQDDYQDSPLRTLDTYEDELTIEQLRAKVAKLEEQLKKAEETEAKEVEEVVQAGRDMYEKLSKKAENVSDLPDDMSELDSVKEKNDEIVKYLKEENERRRNENSQIEKAIFALHQETVFLEKQAEQTLGYYEKLEDVYYQGELDKRQKLFNTLATFRDGDERLSDELQRRENWAEAEKRVHKTYDQYMAKLLIKCDKAGEDKGLVGLLCAISMGRHDNALVEAATGKKVFSSPGKESKIESPTDQPQNPTTPTATGQPGAEPPHVEKVSSGPPAKATVTQQLKEGTEPTAKQAQEQPAGE